MFIDIEWLKKQGACEFGMREFRAWFPNGAHSGQIFRKMKERSDYRYKPWLKDEIRKAIVFARVDRLYPIGSTIRIRSWESMAEQFGIDECGNIPCKYVFLEDMKHLCGQQYTIVGFTAFEEVLVDRYLGYTLSIDMIEPVKNSVT